MNIFEKEQPYLAYFNSDDGIWYVCETCGFQEHLQPFFPSVKSAIIARDNHAMTGCDAPEER